jgi:hypothetical protein
MILVIINKVRPACLAPIWGQNQRARRRGTAVIGYGKVGFRAVPPLPDIVEIGARSIMVIV